MTELVSKYLEVDKWLTGKKEGTAYNYVCALEAYIEFTGLNPTELIDEAELDREKSARERGVPEQKLKKFKEWLLTKYRQKRRGIKTKDKPRNGKIGVSETLANMYCGAIKSFYKANGFPLEVKLGKARKKRNNFKLVIRAPEMSKLLSVATSLRDKAIIKFMFESNQGVSEVCFPNIGDIKRYKEDGQEIWQFHIIRKKTSTEYYTEIGEECIELFKLYFQERERSGEKLTEFSPLFVKEGRQKFSRQRITPNLIENMLKTLAIKSGLVTERQMELADLNPARPHALRSSSMSVLKLAGYPETAVEFRSGHELSPTDQAYFMARPEELRQTFRKHYNALRVKGTTQFDTQEVKKLRDMLAEKEITIGALAENGKLKVAELDRLRRNQVEMKKMIEAQQKQLEHAITSFTLFQRFFEATKDRENFIEATELTLALWDESFREKLGLKVEKLYDLNGLRKVLDGLRKRTDLTKSKSEHQ